MRSGGENSGAAEGRRRRDRDHDIAEIENDAASSASSHSSDGVACRRGPGSRKVDAAAYADVAPATLPEGTTDAPANDGVTGVRFVTPDATGCSDASSAYIPLSRPSPAPQRAAPSKNVSVFGLQTAAGPRPSAFAPVRNHASGQQHWPRATEDVAKPVTRPVSSSLNDWNAKPAVSGDAAKELALRLGALRV